MQRDGQHCQLAYSGTLSPSGSRVTPQRVGQSRSCCHQHSDSQLGMRGGEGGEGGAGGGGAGDGGGLHGNAVERNLQMNGSKLVQSLVCQPQGPSSVLVWS
jgi:hypothetical protein